MTIAAFGETCETWSELSSQRPATTADGVRPVSEEAELRLLLSGLQSLRDGETLSIDVTLAVRPANP